MVAKYVDEKTSNDKFKQAISETEKQIKLLKKLLKQSNSESQKKLINTDLRKLENGYLSEQENAYYLDFHLGASVNHILLHNIRIEHNNRVAQIDHLLISRMGVTLLESKSFKGVLEIKDDGSLSVDYKKYTKTFSNPIEQNNRHQLVLSELINDLFDLPVNTKIFGGLKFYTKVLINPNTTLKNKHLPDGYERADKYATARLKEIDKMSLSTVLKTGLTMLTIEKVKELEKFLLKHNKPFIFDYSKKYRIKSCKASHKQEPNKNYGKKDCAPEIIYNTNVECSKCKSKNIKIEYGRYGYYFRCGECEGSTSINHTCNTPNCKPKTKKKKLQFFKVCEACGIDELFWENKS